jgi:hypothetical protein
VQKGIKFLGFISGVKPRVSKLLRRHLSGESDGKEEVAPMVGISWKDIWNHGAFPCVSNILGMVRGAQEAVITAFKGPEAVGHPVPGFSDRRSPRLRTTEIDPSWVE